MKHEHFDVMKAVVSARAMLCVAASIPNFNDLQEISIGHKPEDAPNDECVVIHMTACYADASGGSGSGCQASEDEDQ